MGAVTLIFAPLIVVVSIWLYTLVFAFAALWFAHFALVALSELRTRQAAAAGLTTQPTVTQQAPPPLLPPTAGSAPSVAPSGPSTAAAG
jgi:hypothetical protein